MEDTQAVATTEAVPVEGGGPKSFPAANPLHQAFESGRYPYARLMGRATYEAEKAKLQAELLKVQIWAQDTGQKFVILMEGRDAAGKGGTIKRFMEHLNPRYARVCALTKPSDVEKGQWFFQRYLAHLPTAGEMVFYDRSWYNRAGVERVMGFCSPHRIPRIHASGARAGADARPVGDPTLQILVQRDAGRAAGTVHGAGNGPVENVEAVAHRQGEPRPLGRLH